MPHNSARPTEPSVFINQRTLKLIEDYKRSSDVGRSNFRSVNNLTTQTSHEYGNRFLFELIQNAYDAHPSSTTDGIIHVKLVSDEGQHGVLYVANQGEPFGEANFEAICQLAQSNKTPGEGIGNKGVGFRSVLQICEWPEIYSAALDANWSDTFTGFCFGFARPENLRVLAEYDDSLFEAMSHDISPYSLPVALTSQPEAVTSFAAQGFATVVRLPINSEAALTLTRQQMDEIRRAKAPVMLFLDRLSELVLEEKGGVEDYRFSLKRSPEPLPVSASQINARYEVVGLGEQGRFFVAKCLIDLADLTPHIQESIRVRKLPPSWAKWKGEAWVSVATRLDSEEGDFCLYNFLPMSNAKSPFQGFLNAPFYAKTDRTDLHEDVPLNSFLIDVTARLCVESIFYLKKSRADYSAAAILDLLVWRRTDRHRLEQSFQGLGQNITEATIIPILPGRSGKKWGALSTAYYWQHNDLRYINLKILVAAADAELLRPGLGQARSGRLHEFCLPYFDVGLTPSPTTKAEWIEEVAKKLHSGSFDIHRWDNFYDDVAKLFALQDEALVGRKLLLGADGRLHACGQSPQAGKSGRDAVVFFQPIRTRAEGEEQIDVGADISIPANLNRHICYMHPDLTWLEGEGRTRKRKQSRTFFENKGLIKRYETRDLLEHVSLLLARTKSDEIRRDALKWTYSLQQAVNYNQRPGLNELNLHVPTASGWVPANEAYFSSDWPNTHGHLLTRFIKETQTVSKELCDLEEQLILPPGSWPFKLGDVLSWVDFLKKVGVRDGLWPKNVHTVEQQQEGRYTSPEGLRQALALVPEEHERWRKEVNLTNRTPQHPYTPYRIKGTLRRLPGQSDYGSFSDGARKAFAQLVTASIGQWPDDTWSFNVSRPLHPRAPDTMSWPTPLMAFLNQTKWVPMARPADRDRWEFHRPTAAWHFPESSEEYTPPFSPLIPRQIRRLIDHDKKTLDTFKSKLRLKVWNDPQHSAHLVLFLGKLLDSQGISELSIDSYRKTYAAAWTQTIAGHGNPYFLGNKEQFLVVSRGGKLSPVNLNLGKADEGDPIYVVDCEDTLRLNLLESLGLQVLNIGVGNGGAVLSILRQKVGARARPVSATPLKVLIDGEPFAPNPESPLLINEATEWLKTFVVLTLEFRALLPTHKSERTKQTALRRLGQIRLKTANSINIRIDDQDSPLPPNVDTVIPVDHGQYPTLIIVEGKVETTWQMLELIASPLARLLGYPSIAVPLRLALVLLARQLDGRETSSPTDADFAFAFNEKEERVREVRFGLKSSAVALLENLRPVIYHFAGAEAADQFSEKNEALTTEESILAELSRLRDQLGMEAKEVLQTCREADSLSALRDRMGIGYADFNRALSALGVPYNPIRNPEGHRNALTYFKQQNRESILGSLRQRFLDDFRAGVPLPEYVQLKTLDSLVPNPTWLDICDIPDKAMLLEQTNKWLAAVGASPIGTVPLYLPPFDEVRRENSKILDSVIKEMLNVVPLWCWKHTAQIPSLWMGADPSGQARQFAEADCLLDFERLTPADVLSWVQRKGQWPSAMPPTTDRDTLGLSLKDVEDRKKQIDAQKNAHDVERRSIKIGGKSILAEPENYSVIAELVASTITEGFLASPKWMSKLEEIDKGGPRGSIKQSTWWWDSRSKRPTEQQRNAVGLTGEVIAFRWLKHHYGDVVNDDSWKSTYKNHVLGGSTGNDSLGYDFEVVLKRGTLLFEVKTSMSDRMEIELGETEVEQAQRNSTKNRYRIIYIGNVLDPDKRFIRVLPNPFSKRGRGFFRLVGTGLRYQFKLTG